MKTIFADYESFYSNEYTLTKLDPASYILHPLFEATCLGIAEDTGTPYIVDGPDVARFWRECDPNCAVVSHNCLFDACITSWHFNFVPKLIIDTIAISRSLIGHALRSVSLKAVAKHLGLPDKGGFLALAKGMTRADLIANGMWQQYTEYCLNDVELCRSIFLELGPQLPDEEYIIHDMVTRCAVEPMFRLNTSILAEHLAAVRAEKEEMFRRASLAGIDNVGQLMSNPQFAEILQRLGIDPPMKKSLATGQMTYAFSRQDVDFMDLQTHEDPQVQAVMAARLGFKSTLEETRTERMLKIAELAFPYHGINVMPIPLKIGAAITHRLGGDWQLNCQNWGRQSPIRRAVEAPEGYNVVSSDAAQIEARLTAWFCGQWDMVERFARGVDEYAEFASFVYGYPVNKRDHPGPRFVGKTGVLQLGYQSGPTKFQRTVLLLSTKDGAPIELTDEQAVQIVHGYRHKYFAISHMWRTLGNLIPWMADCGDAVHTIGPMTFTEREVTGPTGLKLYYDNLSFDTDVGQWLYSYADRTYQLFGGKLLENIIQHLARVATMQAALRIRRRLTVDGLQRCKFSHQAHDELIYLCPTEMVDLLAEIVHEEMSRTPDWAPGLPLRGEVKVGLNYGEMRPL